APIDLYAYCRYVDKGNSKSNHSILIPFNSINEWQSFINAAPLGDADIYFARCIRGGAVNLPANYGSAPVTNQCATVTSTPNPQQVVAPYHRPVNNSWTSGAVTYSCQSADGTVFSETVVGIYTGVVATDGDGSIGWTLDPTQGGIQTNYNGVCGASAGGAGASAAPTSGLCHVGVASAVAMDTTGKTYNWTCAGGSSGGTTASCQTPYVAASCTPSAVANGTVGAAPSCTITCNSGYTLGSDNQSCVPNNICATGGNGIYQCQQGTASNTVFNGVIGQNSYGTYTWNCAYNSQVQNCSFSIPACFDEYGSQYYCGRWIPPGPTCNPASVTNGTVNADCSITCNSGYTLSGNSCVQQTCGTFAYTQSCIQPVGWTSPYSGWVDCDYDNCGNIIQCYPDQGCS
ncbi:MAG: hypothetical protein JO253_01090, partial [Alphaproteobacteria bacterium]|nr:hypothetical protein [Alphaproteobacteria bacterium]